MHRPMGKDLSFDVIVIGGGHAGCEAAAASRFAWQRWEPTADHSLPQHFGLAAERSQAGWGV